MLVVLLVVIQFWVAVCRPTEEERVRLWREKHTWPPQWQPESPSFRRLMEEREAEIMSLTGADERWENWMQFVQGRLVRKFTERGFELIQTPPSVHARLKAAVDAAIENWDDLPYEDGVADSIYGFDTPKFVQLQSLAWEVARELKPLHEAWAGGIPLRATSVYGVRLYQNGSTIVMHNDKPQTHVISSIIHIAHKYDEDGNGHFVPWPIHIEDHDGNLHAVNLEEGQMLFYESARCLHGRMRMLQGKYYGSLFVHYQPVDQKEWSHLADDVIAAVPPHWYDGVTEDHGSRWAGQAITTDSRVVDNAPPRVTGEQLHVERNYRDEQEEYFDSYAQFLDQQGNDDNNAATLDEEL